jgi:hypothetical protein
MRLRNLVDSAEKLRCDISSPSVNCQRPKGD